jgi:uncharacterized membrane protein HdeD (DUF308 family)
MSTGLGSVVLGGLEIVKRNWGWFLALGIAQIILGAIAINAAVFVSVISVKVFGWLLLFGGILSVVHAFWERQWSGFFIDLLTGILYAIVGFIIITHPVENAILFTLMMAVFFMVGGVFRIVEAFVFPCPHWFWVLLNGVITTALGIMIWRQWPYSGLWVIGLFIGIEMILYGWSLVMIGLAARNLPLAAAPRS